MKPSRRIITLLAAAALVVAPSIGQASTSSADTSASSAQSPLGSVAAPRVEHRVRVRQRTCVRRLRSCRIVWSDTVPTTSWSRGS